MFTFFFWFGGFIVIFFVGVCGRRGGNIFGGFGGGMFEGDGGIEMERGIFSMFLFRFWSVNFGESVQMGVVGLSCRNCWRCCYSQSCYIVLFRWVRRFSFDIFRWLVRFCAYLQLLGRLRGGGEEFFEGCRVFLGRVWQFFGKVRDWLGFWRGRVWFGGRLRRRRRMRMIIKQGFVRFLEVVK